MLTTQANKLVLLCTYNVQWWTVHVMHAPWKSVHEVANQLGSS